MTHDVLVLRTTARNACTGIRKQTWWTKTSAVCATRQGELIRAEACMQRHVHVAVVAGRHVAVCTGRPVCTGSAVCMEPFARADANPSQAACIRLDAAQHAGTSIARPHHSLPASDRQEPSCVRALPTAGTPPVLQTSDSSPSARRARPASTCHVAGMDRSRLHATHTSCPTLHRPPCMPRTAHAERCTTPHACPVRPTRRSQHASRTAVHL
jgi:hypothetical protein